jgi:hypothetical protein
MVVDAGTARVLYHVVANLVIVIGTLIALRVYARATRRRIEAKSITGAAI